jgi:hypothetical protein
VEVHSLLAEILVLLHCFGALFMLLLPALNGLLIWVIVVGRVAPPLGLLFQLPDEVSEDACLIFLWPVLGFLQDAGDAQAKFLKGYQLCPASYALVHAYRDIDESVLWVDPSLNLVEVVGVQLLGLYDFVENFACHNLVAVFILLPPGSKLLFL